MRIFAAMRLTAALASLVAAWPAGAQAPKQDPSSSPEIVKLADLTTDCITTRYLAAREAARRDAPNEVVPFKAGLKDALRQCRPEIRLLKTRYDEVFGPGMGEAFLRQSYYPDLNRAMMERILDTPEKRREIAALQKSHRYISGADTQNCRYKTLLDKNIQEKVNRAIATIKLREELVGKRFAMTQSELDLDIGEKDGLPFEFANPQEIEACFPAMKQRMRALHEEYDAKAKTMHKAQAASRG